MDGLFVKLMMMTTSANDQEALVALRKANRILSEAKVSWIELLSALSQKQTAAPPPRPEPAWEDVGSEKGKRHTDAKEIDGLFDIVLEQKMSDGFEEFLTSVHIWWKQKGFLTDKQYKAVKRAAERKDFD